MSRRFRPIPKVEVLNDKPHVAIIKWLWWCWLYRSPSPARDNTVRCRDCGETLYEWEDTSLLFPEPVMRWATVDEDEWMCDETGKEHRVS